MSLKTKILLLTILPLVLVAGAIALINTNQARILSNQEIETFEQNLLISKKQALENYISLALTSIDHIISDLSLDEQTAREEVKHILNRLTYGDDGYFFVYDQQGTNLVHPILSDIVGQNLYDMQDSNDNYVIRNLLQIAAEGGGFYGYYWNKPSSNIEEAKISYVVQLPRWQWMMGTGLYIDDIASEVAKIRAQVDSNIKNTFFTMIMIITATVIIIILIGIAINLHESRLADMRLRKLAHQTVRLQVSERRRFARELHDGINQLMVSVKFRIESAIDRLQKNQGDALEELDSGLGVLNSAIQEVRRVSHDLRPRLLDDMGLETALDNLIGQFNERTGNTTSLKIEFDQARLPEEFEITLYRVIQEALTNIERHAGNCHVRLRIKQRRGSIQLSIKDDGCGFKIKSKLIEEGIGLRNMRERIELLSGVFELHSNVNEGTRLKADLPMSSHL
jgi:two-component system NarL family sensor kinase